jgi:hypothetical protein
MRPPAQGRFLGSINFSSYNSYDLRLVLIDVAPARGVDSCGVF